MLGCVLVRGHTQTAPDRSTLYTFDQRVQTLAWAHVLVQSASTAAPIPMPEFAGEHDIELDRALWTLEAADDEGFRAAPGCELACDSNGRCVELCGVVNEPIE